MSKQFTSLFELDDFRPYLSSWARAKGRGEFKRIADFLQMHTTLVSQIINGKKCFTEEQAAQLCIHMGLKPVESDYFIKLVQLERAGNKALKDMYRRHVAELRQQSQEMRLRIPETKGLSESDRAVFYSSWQFAMVRILTDIPGLQTVESISKRLGLSISRTQEILNTLVSLGLCEKTRDTYKRTPKNTHIEAGASLAIRHHQNWRVKSVELLERMTADDLAFSGVVSLSREDFPKVKRTLAEAISEVSKKIERSPSENCAYLCIDWLAL